MLPSENLRKTTENMGSNPRQHYSNFYKMESKMKITLRKANVVQSSINELLKSLETKAQININEFQDPETVLRSAKDAFMSGVARKLSLLEALTDIRVLVGIANESSDINARLTHLACLDKQINLLSSFVAPVYLQTDLIIINGQLNKIKSSTVKDSYYAKTDVTTGILSQEDIDFYTVSIKQLKKDKQKLQDKILELNFQTEIELSDSIVRILTSEGII